MMTTIKDTWDDYLAGGEKLEQSVSNYLVKDNRHKGVNKMPGNFPDYDLIASNGTKYEVKRDYKGNDTGNLFFEIKWRNNWSGLAKTKADYWVHCCKDAWYIFDVNQLKTFIQGNWEYLKKTKAGNNKDSWGVLINRKDISKIGKIDIVEKSVVDKFV